MARVALDAGDTAEGFHAAKLATARFYFSRLLPETEMQQRVARAEVSSVMAAECFPDKR
jgi:hypothetical protein